MACQSAISGMFQNISRAKARAPGVLPKVVAMVVHMACIAVASASSIMSQAWVKLCWGLVYTSILSSLFTVWCILSQIALDCGFLLVEHTSLMLKISNGHWKFCPMNSPPLSCKHRTGWGYWQSQLWVNLIHMCLAVSLSTWISLTKFEATSIQVNALNLLVDHQLWLSMAQSNWWQLLPRVQSTPLIWVGDYINGLLIFIFGNLCTSIYEFDSAAWDDDNVGSTSHVTFFHQDVPLLGGTSWQYQLALIKAMQFFNWVELDLSYNWWCHQHCHPVVSWHNCLDIWLVQQAVVHPAAEIHKCAMGFDLDVEYQESWDSTQYIPRHHLLKDQSILYPRNMLHLHPH